MTRETQAAICRAAGMEPLDYRGKSVQCRVCPDRAEAIARAAAAALGVKLD